ncbi:MAG: ABC transporter permease [Mycobacteriaceae bacterium]
MLVWSRRSRWGVLTVFGVLFGMILLAPLLIVVLAAFASEWNSVLPGGLTTTHLQAALSADNLASLSVSIQTALLSGAAAVLVGTAAALSAARLPRMLRRTVDLLFHLPVAVPSVVVGLGMLVAFSQPPILLNGTRWIVIAAQAVLVLAFAYSTVSAALLRLDPGLAQIASSLGARPTHVLRRVELPLLLPAIAAAASLSVALCMGELGATIMLYPASWRTLPISIFGLSDRGDTFLASADTLVLLLGTYLLLTVISGAGRVRIPRLSHRSRH